MSLLLLHKRCQRPACWAGGGSSDCVGKVSAGIAASPTSTFTWIVSLEGMSFVIISTAPTVARVRAGPVNSMCDKRCRLRQTCCSVCAPHTHRPRNNNIEA